MSLPVVGRSLILLGATLAVVGLVLMLFPKIPILGKLPGDLHIKRDNVG